MKQNLPLVKVGRAKDNTTNPTVIREDRTLDFLKYVDGAFYVKHVFLECNGRLHMEENMSYEEMDSGVFKVGDLREKDFLEILKDYQQKVYKKEF